MAEESKTLPNQAKETAVDVRNEAIVQSANLYLLVRKLLLASLGAVAMTADEAGEFLDRLVERGEVAETDVQKMLSEYRASRKAPAKAIQAGKATQAHKADAAAAKAAAKKVSGPIEGSVESILDRLNVPSRSDIEALSKKISQLDAKVSELKAKKAEKEPA